MLAYYDKTMITNFVLNFSASWLGAFVAYMIASRLIKKEDKPKIQEMGTGSMKDHVYTEIIPKKTVFRDKEIIQEEEFHG